MRSDNEVGGAFETLLQGFKNRMLEVADGVEIAVSVAGTGSPLLLLHGHPQTRVLWHKVAPTLASRHTVVLADLRGYGDSSKPPPAADQTTYSKRTMAADLVEVMRQLDFSTFDVLAHDRGARVGHRMAMDHPNTVRRLALLDIAPTLAMYEQAGWGFAKAYWHWFYNVQASPLPERAIEADPRFYIESVMGRRSAGMAPFHPLALDEYVRCLSLPGAAYAVCADYRAAEGVDLTLDFADREAHRKLHQPILALWAVNGAIQQFFDPLREWQRVASNVRGESLPCGHYIAEECPEDLLERVLPFFASGAAI